ncbi:ABC-2 type transport system permease protein [Parelusimicrobium proximum]|uniref:ABC transporter permease n=1 Tax=Parelusimicrobium proximum TaxID=3228953 RepID=UPI003D165774
MKIRPKVIFGFIKKELIQVVRDKKLLGAIIFLPVMQCVIFGLALNSEVKNIELAVVAAPGDRIAERIRTKAAGTGWFKDAKGADIFKLSNPSDLIINKQAEVVIAAPKEGMAAALNKGDKPIQILINATDAMRAKQIEIYVQSVILGVIKESVPEMPLDGLIKVDSRILFNHYMHTPYFMVPALMAMATFIIIMLFTAMAIAKEKEAGTMEKLLASPISTAEILIGKTLPYIMIGFYMTLLLFAVGILGFGVPFRGTFTELLINTFFLVITAVSVAVALSTVSATQQQAMMACILVLVPAVLMSAVLFPVENFPKAVRWLCYLDPLMYATANFRVIMLKGGDIGYFAYNCAVMLLIGGVLAVFSVKKFKNTLN